MEEREPLTCDKTFSKAYWTYIWEEAFSRYHPLRQGVHIQEILNRLKRPDVSFKVRITAWRENA